MDYRTILDDGCVSITQNFAIHAIESGQIKAVEVDLVLSKIEDQNFYDATYEVAYKGLIDSSITKDVMLSSESNQVIWDLRYKDISIIEAIWLIRSSFEFFDWDVSKVKDLVSLLCDNKYFDDNETVMVEDFFLGVENPHPGDVDYDL